VDVIPRIWVDRKHWTAFVWNALDRNLWTQSGGGNSTDFGGGTRLDRIRREYGREKLLLHEVSSLQGKMIIFSVRKSVQQNIGISVE
jgi:hypothetical protein